VPSLHTIRIELEARRVLTATHQSVFREVNERSEDIRASASFEEFVCECTVDDCSETVAMTVEEYERIRQDSGLFFVLCGHEVAELEEVVEATGRYVVVRKLGAGKPVAARLDPRGG
jgi:hypothetical protein